MSREGKRASYTRWRLRNKEKRNTYLREWCKKNPEARFKRYLRHRLKSKYNMTIGEYKEKLNKQDYRCKICSVVMDVPTPKHRVKNGQSATIDHCHEIGVVRGILCNNCNRMIGLAGDDINILLSAVSYLLELK